MENTSYELAKERVQKIKGFWTHLGWFLAINILIVYFNFKNLEEGESYFQLKNFYTFIFWGIGLAGHAFSVFAPNVLFGKKWEEEKIKKLMEKYKNEERK